jgi:hypothetical protein
VRRLLWRATGVGRTSGGAGTIIGCRVPEGG